VFLIHVCTLKERRRLLVLGMAPLAVDKQVLCDGAFEKAWGARRRHTVAGVECKEKGLSEMITMSPMEAALAHIFRLSICRVEREVEVPRPVSMNRGSGEGGAVDTGRLIPMSTLGRS
jgi:hypothetical protein